MITTIETMPDSQLRWLLMRSKLNATKYANQKRYWEKRQRELEVELKRRRK